MPNQPNYIIFSTPIEVQPAKKPANSPNRHSAGSSWHLAQEGGAHSAQFRRLFREHMQMSPSDYITKVRVNAAKTLLATTGRRISDIAEDVGFFDHAHFIRTFKRIVGATPAKYRKDLTLRAHSHA